MKLNLFEIDEDYVKYLHSFNGNVHNVKGLNGRIYVQTVKYVGKFENSLPSFAPLSSDKNRLHVNDDNDSFFPLVHRSEYLGVIRICNQIPLPKESKLFKQVHINDFILSNDEQRRKYGFLLKKQYELINYGNNDYSLIEKSLKMSLENFSYKHLAKAARVYDIDNELIKERINAYPKVFSSSENKIFFGKLKKYE